MPDGVLGDESANKETEDESVVSLTSMDMLVKQADGTGEDAH